MPRVSDLDALVASTRGKVEIETLEDGRRGAGRRAAAEVRGAHRVQATGARSSGSATCSPRSTRARSCRPATTAVDRVRRDACRGCPRSPAPSTSCAAARRRPRWPVGHRVRARGAPPVEAAQQGRGRRPAPYRTAAGAGTGSSRPPCSTCRGSCSRSRTVPPPTTTPTSRRRSAAAIHWGRVGHAVSEVDGRRQVGLVFKRSAHNRSSPCGTPRNAGSDPGRGVDRLEARLGP